MEISCEDLTFLFNNVKNPTPSLYLWISLYHVHLQPPEHLSDLQLESPQFGNVLVVLGGEVCNSILHHKIWTKCTTFLFLSPLYTHHSVQPQISHGANGSGNGLCYYKEKNMKIFFHQSLGHCRMSASLIPGYERYAYFFQVNRKLVEFSLGVILMENHR